MQLVPKNNENLRMEVIPMNASVSELHKGKGCYKAGETRPVKGECGLQLALEKQ